MKLVIPMASYQNFQSGNAKYTRMDTRNNYNADLNSAISALGDKNKTAFDENLDKYVKLASWINWYPDLFLDLMTPEEGGIKLHVDQRIYLRCILRFFSVYGVFPRGWSKTYLEVLAMFVVAIRFPAIELALTAQTKENAAEILKDKCQEILKHFPMLNNEVFDKKFSKGDAEVLFVNGSRIDILANSQTSKGQRRKRINIEESALLDDTTFQDALKPIVEVSRYTTGKLGIVNPEELNQQINFFSTSGEYAPSYSNVC